MKAQKGTLKTCRNGNEFYKNNACPICPIFENGEKPDDGFLSEIGAPARRALESEDTTTLRKFSELTEKEVLGL